MPMGRGLASVFGLCGALCASSAGCGVNAGEDALVQSGDTQDTQDFAPTPARGISILEVEMNQGTRIPIGVGGEWIAETDRLSDLIASRDSLLRIHYTVDATWVPREIEARLMLDFPDGTSESFTDVRMIEGDSSREDINSAFYFELVAGEGQTVAGTRYSIELWELSPGGESLPDGDWANPAAGSQPLGFQPQPMQIKTVLVPITYQDTTVTLDEAITQQLLDNLYEQNPASEIIYAIHEPVAYDGQLIDLANLLPVIAELRSSENADPNVYYHAFIDVGGSSIAGLFGISYIANDNEDDANSRVSATVLWSPNPTLAAETFTHETGHAQGLAHVECPTVAAAEPDSTYPHAEGRIGNWGFGIRELMMHDPEDAYDYMSYCEPSWVSDWTWNKVAQRVQTLTAWDFEGASNQAQPSEQLLVVAVYADGRRQWWTMPGSIDPERISELDRIEFELQSGEVIESHADVATLSDGRTRWVKAPLPNRARSELAAIRHVRGSEVVGAAWADVDLHPGRTSAWQPIWVSRAGRR
jgi:hypothetical protein